MSMDEISLIKKYLPLTEATYYIMLSLVEPRHGYGIMQHVDAISNSKTKLSPGTLYGALGKLEKEKLIKNILTEERKKYYILTDDGMFVLYQEILRLHELVTHGLPQIEVLRSTIKISHRT